MYRVYYKCNKCDHRFVLSGIIMSDKDNYMCPKCCSEDIELKKEKIIS